MLQIRRNVLRIARRINTEIHLGNLTLRVDEKRVALCELEQAEIAQRAVSLCDVALAIREQANGKLYLRENAAWLSPSSTLTPHTVAPSVSSSRIASRYLAACSVQPGVSSRG